MQSSNLRGTEDMIGFESVDVTLRQAMAIADSHEQLSAEDVEEFEVRAALRAIPAARREELLAGLRAVIRADTTHTVKESFNA